MSSKWKITKVNSIMPIKHYRKKRIKKIKSQKFKQCQIFFCETCQKKFKIKQDLEAHMEDHHLSLVCATKITCQCTICVECLSEWLYYMSIFLWIVVKGKKEPRGWSWADGVAPHLIGPLGTFSHIVAMSVHLSVGENLKHPIPGVVETSGQRTYR
jgi:hypothetical protein